MWWLGDWQRVSGVTLRLGVVVVSVLSWSLGRPGRRGGCWVGAGAGACRALPMTCPCAWGAVGRCGEEAACCLATLLVVGS